MSREHRRCLIIGSGPAGYTAAIYASRANLSPLLYEGIQPGGQLTQTTDVENFPGYPEGVTGPALTQDLRNQALRFGTEIRSGLATKADLSKAPYVITSRRVSRSKPIRSSSLRVLPLSTSAYPTKRSTLVWASRPVLPVTASSIAIRRSLSSVAVTRPAKRHSTCEPRLARLYDRA